jgi:hypothetical protein
MATLQPGDKLGSVVGFPDRYGDTLWLRLGTEPHHCSEITVIMFPTNKWGAVAKTNRGATKFVALENIEVAELLDGSRWMPPKLDRSKPSWMALQDVPEFSEESRWESQRQTVGVICVLIALLALGVPLWMAVVEPWLSDLFAQSELAARARYNLIR